MKNTGNFILGQSRRDNTREVQLTPHKRSAVLGLQTNMKHIITLLLLLVTFTVAAQSYSPCYTEFMAKGNAAYNQGKYSEAKTYYAKAKQCAGGNPTEAQKKISACEAKIKAQQDEAEAKRKAEQEAAEAKRKEEEAKRKAEQEAAEAKRKAEQEAAEVKRKAEAAARQRAIDEAKSRGYEYKSPKIQFDQTSYDFGKIKEEDGKVTTRFYFTNVGGGELLLVSVRPGCGCTTTDYTKTAVGPGQRGYIDATYNPSNRPGAFNKNIKITTNEPEMQVEKPTPHMIFIKGEVLPKQSSETSNSGEKAKKEAEEERIKEEIRQADLYGNEDEMQRLRKSCSSKLTDYDGNTYNTVLIGKQCWMKENMRTTHYANGSSIPMGSTYSYTDAYRYCPDNNCSNVSTYGYLYNWAAVMNGSPSSDQRPSGVQGICPRGWHVPSEMEWYQLLFYVERQPKYQCEESKYRIAKSLSSTMGWKSSDKSCVVGNNPSTNNIAGFSALPAGKSLSKCCHNWGEKAVFWTATQDKDDSAFNLFISYDSYSALVTTFGFSKYNGYSVRCIKD